MLTNTTTRAEIKPYFTNHSLRATTFTVPSERNVEPLQIKVVTGHRSDTSIESYCERPTLRQFRNMSTALSSFVHGDESAQTDVPAICPPPLPPSGPQNAVVPVCPSCSNATKLSEPATSKFPRWKRREPRCHSALCRKLPELLLHF